MLYALKNNTRGSTLAYVAYEDERYENDVVTDSPFLKKELYVGLSLRYPFFRSRAEQLTGRKVT